MFNVSCVSVTIKEYRSVDIEIFQYDILAKLSRIQMTYDVQKYKLHKKHVSGMQSPYYTKNLLSRCIKPVHYYKMALTILLQTMPQVCKMVSNKFVSNTLLN